MLNLLVFPNDPLSAYIKKGEVKIRYFNPNNIFKHIYFVDFSLENTKIEDIKVATGNANVTIFTLPPIGLYEFFFPKKVINSILEIIESLEVDVARGYSSTLSGFFAKEVGKYKKIPSVISLHTNFNDMRYQFLKRKDFLRWAKYAITKFTLEKQTLNEVTQIVAAYNFTKKYALDMGVDEKKIEVIYNKVFFDKFYPSETIRDEKNIRVISVGNLEVGKGQRVLVDAFARLPEYITLTLVGNGEDYTLLRSKVKEYGLENRVNFIRSIPNLELAKLYREHDIFSLPIQYGGVCIPALEATASGLPLVMPKPIHEEIPEITGEYAEIVENTPKGFATGILKVSKDINLREKMRANGLATIQKFSGDIMEKKEAELYTRLCKCSFE